MVTGKHVLGTINIPEKCDIMIDQIRVVDNKQLIKKSDNLPGNLIDKVKENIGIMLDLEKTF